jgi:hypothetical protein
MTIIGAQPKPWLQAWEDKWGVLAKRKVKICGALGHEFHRCIESWLNTGTYAVGSPVDEETGRHIPSLVPRVERMLAEWVGWARAVSGTIDHTELRVVSRAHTYSGTLDAVGRIGKTPMVIDWKTSSRIYPDMVLQLSAYAEAYNEQAGGRIKTGLIVHVDKRMPHRVTAKEFKLGKRPFRRFLRLKAVFDRTKAEENNAEAAIAEETGC